MARTHGTPSCYQSGCRCEQCRKANAEKTRLRRAARKREGRVPAKHGETGYGNYGCRCTVCVSAWRDRCRVSYEAERVRIEQRRSDGVTPPEHGVNGYRSWGCRCEVCVSAAREYSAEVTRRAQDRSLEHAHRYRAEWTGPELELAARTDITHVQLAEMLGRTVHAVRTKRHKLRTKPREQWLAGKRSKLH